MLGDGRGQAVSPVAPHTFCAAFIMRVHKVLGSEHALRLLNGRVKPDCIALARKLDPVGRDAVVADKPRAYGIDRVL